MAEKPDPESLNTDLALSYYVYLLASGKHGTLYVGMTRDLIRRVYEHRQKVVPGFTARDGVERLVRFEVRESPTSAVEREKKIEKWRRDWKTRLGEERNPAWVDLYDGICR